MSRVRVHNFSISLDGFGTGVALTPDGATLIGGAPGATVSGTANAGAAFVFGPVPYSLFLPLALRQT